MVSCKINAETCRKSMPDIKIWILIEKFIQKYNRYLTENTGEIEISPVFHVSFYLLQIRLQSAGYGVCMHLQKQGMRESNSRQRFWRPLSYHLTNPLFHIIKHMNVCPVSIVLNTWTKHIYYYIGFRLIVNAFLFFYTLCLLETNDRTHFSQIPC